MVRRLFRSDDKGCAGVGFACCGRAAAPRGLIPKLSAYVPRLMHPSRTCSRRVLHRVAARHAQGRRHRVDARRVRRGAGGGGGQLLQPERLGGVRHGQTVGWVRDVVRSWFCVCGRSGAAATYLLQPTGLRPGFKKLQAGHLELQLQRRSTTTGVTPWPQGCARHD